MNSDFFRCQIGLQIVKARKERWEGGVLSPDCDAAASLQDRVLGRCPVSLGSVEGTVPYLQGAANLCIVSCFFMCPILLEGRAEIAVKLQVAS